MVVDARLGNPQTLRQVSVAEGAEAAGLQQLGGDTHTVTTDSSGGKTISPAWKGPVLPDVPEGLPVFVAGRTHSGEEEIILSAFATLKKKHPDLLNVQLLETLLGG